MERETSTGAFWNGVQRAAKEIAQELKHKLAHGAHELAAGLFNGHGFVMYPRNQAAEQNQSQEKQPERGHGRSM